MDSGDDEHWLDHEEAAAWMSLVAILILLPAHLDTQLRRDSGISHFEYQVLAGLSMAPESSLRMSDLAVFTNGSLSRLSHAAAKLERLGWITRGTDPSDSRYTLATLTEAGSDKVIESAPGHVRAVRDAVFGPLTGEQIRQLREIGQRVREAIDPGGRWDPPTVGS